MPLVATLPDHAQLPPAVQDVAFVLDQLIVELPPEEIVEGLNAMVAVGVGVAADAWRPPAPSNPMAIGSSHLIACRVGMLALTGPSGEPVQQSLYYSNLVPP